MQTLSADGTPLAYSTVGAGPAVLVIHGAMQAGASHTDLAGLLSGRFTVILMDRRGRGASGGDPVHGLDDEVADVRAVLDATGASAIFGVSSGAIIAARTALVDVRITRLALFEPPLPVAGSIRLDLVPALESAVQRDDLPAALALGMRLAEMGPPWMFRLPLAVLALLSRARLRSPGIPAQARGLATDTRIVRESADLSSDFSELTCDVLLVDGTATRPYLRVATAELARVIPGARHVELAGQWHGVTGNSRDHGRPQLIAPTLLAFFSGDQRTGP